jgi:hypothetical protein
MLKFLFNLSPFTVAQLALVVLVLMRQTGD